MSAPTTDRRVKVIVEGTMRPLAHVANLMRVTRQDGGVLLIPEGCPGVTIEDVALPRVWTDGDVIAADANVWVRRDGRWYCETSGRSPLPDRSADLSLADRPASTTVLRCQAEVA